MNASAATDNRTTLDLARLANVKPKGDGIEATCPACRANGEDQTGNHLYVDAQGRFGCAKHANEAEHRREIFRLVGVKSAPEPRPRQRKATKPARTWPDPETAAKAITPPGFALVAVCRYPRNGRPFAAVARYEDGTEKTFRQFSMNGDGWKAEGPSNSWPLYAVEAPPESGGVFIVEGEKCQQAAASIGLPCVTSAGGSKAAVKSDWTPLAGRDVCILPDNDPAGEGYASDAAGILNTCEPPARVRVLRLPGLPADGGDLVDYLDARDATDPDALRAELESMAGKAETIEAATVDNGAMDGADVLRADPPPHRPVLAGLFDRQSLVEIVGPSKTRKSFANLQLALSLAAGRDVYGFDIGGRFSVCIADMELSEADIRRRLWRMGRALAIGPEDIEDHLRIVPLAGVECPMKAIEEFAEGFDILICDPIYALCTGREDIEDFRGPLRWLRRMALSRAAAIFIHHDAKGTPGDRDTRDRGSGSGITGRAVDARITLTPAAADPANTVAMGFMARSYVCPEPRAFTFTDDVFVKSDLPSAPERQSDRARQSRPKLAGYHDAALRILNDDGPMSPTVFKRRLRDELNASKGDADDLTARLCEDGGPAVRWREGGFATSWKIGTQKQAATSRLFTGKKQEEGEEG